MSFDGMKKRVCFITLGQSPRPELISEVLEHIREPIDYTEIGALDGLSDGEIEPPRSLRDTPLVTRLASGEQVVVSSEFINRRLDIVTAQIDRLGHDLLVLLASGIFRKFETSTPLIHGQLAVDEWIASFILGTAQLGVVFPLRKQASDPVTLHDYGILIQNYQTVAYSGEASRIDETALLLRDVDFILMHSVGYTKEMAQQLASESHKPVVTARRVIAGALHLRLMEMGSTAHHSFAQASELDLIKRLPRPEEPLTGREQAVLSLVLEGRSNKEIAKQLGISHRTVEIHRSRAMAKYNATTAMQLIRRAMIENPG
jgi:DNA-binding CsgD family transcriptional regulator